MVVNRNTLASPFQAVEQVNRLFVLEEVNLTALVVSNLVIGSGDAVPTQRDNQDLWLRVKKPLNLLERQLVCLGDLPSAAVRTNLKVGNRAGTRTVGGVSVAAPTEAPGRIGDEPNRREHRDDNQHCDELFLWLHWCDVV